MNSFFSTIFICFGVVVFIVYCVWVYHQFKE